MEELEDAFWSELHGLSGVCGHCGKRKCPARKEWSDLPSTLKTSDVEHAMKSAQRRVALDRDEPPAAPPKTETGRP